MRVLAFLHDAYGSLGGISRNNRDVLEAMAADPRVARIVAIPRIAGSGGEAPPAKIDWRRDAGGGAIAFVLVSLRAMFGARPDLILCLHIRLLPVAWLSRRPDRIISISEVTTERFQSWANTKLPFPMSISVVRAVTPVQESQWRRGEMQPKSSLGTWGWNSQEAAR